MTTWTITYESTTVTMPRLPERLEIRKSADVSAITIPGMEPFIFSLGVNSFTIVLSGVLYGSEISVLDSLLGLVYKQVMVSGLGTTYDRSYILREVSWTHQPPNIYTYVIQLEYGSEMISL